MPVGEVALVVDVLCFSGRALYCPWRLYVDVGFDAGKGDETVVERLDERHLLAWVRREELFAQLDVEVEGILVALAIDGDEVLRCEGGELGEHGLYLAWEDIDTTNDEHVVASSQHLSELERSRVR